MNNDNDKSRLVKFGRLPVVSTFTEWPKTQHDPQSFTVDLTLFTVSIYDFYRENIRERISFFA